MITLPRWLAPAVLATGLGIAGFTPTPAQAQGDDLVRVIVDIADVVLRGGQPYYRYGDYGYDDRLIVSRDRYGRPVYYRQVPSHVRSGPPYGNAYGYHRNRGYPVTGTQRTKCNKNGKCTVTYYDPRQDRDDRYRDNRYGDNRYSSNNRYWDGYRWRYRD